MAGQSGQDQLLTIMETTKYFLTILIPLLIIMDPLGNLPFFLLFTKENSESERRRLAAMAPAAAAAILLFFGLTGDFILRFIGISLPAFQLAGGFIFFIYSLQMLRLIPSGIKTSEEEEEEGISKENVALVPLATPLLAGPGAITAVLAWRHSQGTSLALPMLIAAILTSCLIVYIVFRFGERIRKMLGVGGIRVVTRLMGLLLAVIAAEFIINGLRQI